MSKKDNCNSNSNRSTATITYTYSQFSIDQGKNDPALSTSGSNYKKMKKLASEYAQYTMCASYSSGSYNCPGHRDAVDVGTRQMTFADDYNRGDVLSSSQPDKILQNLAFEIEQRKKNALYKSQQQYTKGPYVRGTAVHHDQPVSLATHLNSLNNFIKNVAVAPKLHDGKGDYKHGGAVYGFDSAGYRSQNAIQQPLDTVSGNATYPNDLKPIQPSISVDYNDCICYSDCTNHGTLRTKYCTCNINCLCNY